MANKVKVTITPASGDEIELETNGDTVSQVLKAVNRSSAGMNIFVNGDAANTRTRLKNGDEVKLNERPKGS